MSRSPQHVYNRHRYFEKSLPSIDRSTYHLPHVMIVADHGKSKSGLAEITYPSAGPSHNRYDSAHLLCLYLSPDGRRPTATAIQNTHKWQSCLSLSRFSLAHVSAGIAGGIAGCWNAGVKPVLAFLRLIVQKVCQPLNTHKGVVVCLEQELEFDMSHLRQRQQQGMRAKEGTSHPTG